MTRLVVPETISLSRETNTLKSMKLMNITVLLLILQ
jgi:hypothetical protein